LIARKLHPPGVSPLLSCIFRFEEAGGREKERKGKREKKEKIGKKQICRKC